MLPGFTLFECVVSGRSREKNNWNFQLHFTVDVLILGLKYCVPQLNIFLERDSLKVNGVMLFSDSKANWCTRPWRLKFIDSDCWAMNWVPNTNKHVIQFPLAQRDLFFLPFSCSCLLFPPLSQLLKVLKSLFHFIFKWDRQGQFWF